MIQILFVVYAAGVFLCVYPFAQAIAATAPHSLAAGFDAIDRTLIGAAGLLIALLWPFIVAGFLVYQASKMVWRGTLLDQDTKVNR